MKTSTPWQRYLKPLKDDRFLRISDLVYKVGKSKSQILRDIQEGEFPSPIKVGKKSIAWRQSVVEAWMRYREIEAEKA